MYGWRRPSRPQRVVWSESTPMIGSTIASITNAAQLAIEAAIKENGGGNEAIKKFKNAEPESLRSKLGKLQEVRSFGC